MVDLIIKKRQGHELTDEEIRFWIKGYVDGDIPDYQSSAMQMAIVFQGMNNREIATLTDAMLHSGEVLDLSNIKGVKAVRECEKIEIKDSIIESTEFGWKSSDIKLINSSIISEYLFLDSKNVTLKNVEMKGKYSFQYIDGLIIDDSNLDTKDAFWHSKNVTVRNSIIKGEYLAWFSENLTLINCKIIGTQPFCYCKKLKLINCEMINCDLAFEYSEVEADIIGKVDSIKNPLDGIIKVDEVGEIIHDNPVYPCKGKVVIK